MGGRKSVADAVHGPIELNDLELQIVSTRAFQRLRQVKQLGLAHLVFPGADYSRFSHSLGVCHVMGRILHKLREHDGLQIENEKIACYRLAALLHDVGHYPFSHAMEDALQSYFAGQLVTEAGEEEVAPPEKDGHYLSHEAVGKEVLKLDEEIQAIFAKAGIDAKHVYSIFTRQNPTQKLANLVSSDLDADRIDYLMRTALHTGLPYGNVDLDYLLANMCLDRDEQVCLHPKALRTAEHFLLGRYFDFQQVSYHKTVAGLEMILKDVLRALLDHSFLSASAADVQRQIRDGSWATMDDVRIFQLIRKFATEGKDEVLRKKADAIINRRPPKQVGVIERLAQRSNSERDSLLREKQAITEHMDRWADDFGIDRELWKIWDKPGQVLTKIGSQIPVSAIQDSSSTDFDPEKAIQLIRILDPLDRSSKPIVEVDRSLLLSLSGLALYSLRVYVILPDTEKGGEKLRRQIQSRIRADLPHSHWL